MGMSFWQDIAALVIVVAALAYLGKIAAGWWRGPRGSCYACPLRQDVCPSRDDRGVAGRSHPDAAADSGGGLKKKQPRLLVQINPQPRK